MALVRARYEDYDTFREALRLLKESEKWTYEAFGPTDLSHLGDLMPERRSLVRGWATAGALLGAGGYWIMAVETSEVFDIIVGGKPPISNVPYVTLAFEGAVLWGVVGALMGLLIHARLGTRPPPRDYDPRFSRDSYGVEVRCTWRERAEVMDHLRESGAVEVRAFGLPF